MEDAKVKHEVVELPDRIIDLEADPLTEKLLQIERLNKVSVCYLSSNGFNGSVFKKIAPRQNKLKRNVAVSAPYSRERQDILAKTSNASGQFVASGGGELNSNDWFISTERSNCIVTVKELEKKKKLFGEAKKRALDARAISEKYRAMDKDIKNTEHAQ